MKKIIIAAMMISSVVYGGEKHSDEEYKISTKPLQTPYFRGTGDSFKKEVKAVMGSLIVPTIAAFALSAVQNYYNQVNNNNQ